eukprot:GHUV01044717.1.p3 GENE.GHUV01044717.1~~GHUV01044717.1.p3  ORF type:complete len:112 (+),score=34.82 GHUV01044717.1:519-854(+)
MEGYQELWQLVQQGPDQALRQQVKRGKVQTPRYGELQLDYDPDQIQAIELSDKLKLDEITCVELLTYAQEVVRYAGCSCRHCAQLLALFSWQWPAGRKCCNSCSSRCMQYM